MKIPTVIGQEASPDLVALAASARALQTKLLCLEGPHPDLEWARETLDEISARLAALARPEEAAPRVGPGAEPESTRPYYFPGALEPWVRVAAPPMSAEQEGERRRGRVRFGVIHEGPPGCAHGGFVAWTFDQSFGQHVLECGEIGGPTHHLAVTYRRPTPLHRDLSLEVRTDRVDGRKLFLAGELHDGDVLIAEATALFVRPKSGALALP